MTKKLLAVFASAGFALLIGANAAAVAAEKIVFMIDWLPAGDKAVPYLGVQEGLFAAEGLEVTIQSGRGSSDVVTKLGTGAADLGTGGLAALLQARAQTPVAVKALASIYTLQPDAIFTTEGSGISTLKDVAGKTIATATFSSSNVSWPLVLKANGIDPAKVDLLKADPGALAPMLAAGKVAGDDQLGDGRSGFRQAACRNGQETESHRLVGLRLRRLWTFGVRVRENTDRAPRNGEEIHARLHESDADGDRRSDGRGQGLKAMVPEVDVDVARAQFAASVPLMVNDISKKDGDGAFEKALLAKTWKWTAEAQNMPLDKLDPETAVDRSFLPK